MASFSRLPEETYEDFVARRKANTLSEKRHMRGRLIYSSDTPMRTSRGQEKAMERIARKYGGRVGNPR